MVKTSTDVVCGVDVSDMQADFSLTAGRFYPQRKDKMSAQFKKADEPVVRANHNPLPHTGVQIIKGPHIQQHMHWCASSV